MTALQTVTLHQDSRPSRRLVLVDIENFNCSPIQCPAEAKWCKRMLTSWLNIQEGEIIVIASDKSGILNVNAGWKGPRLLMGLGPDGADLRLIEEIERMNLGQFDEIALVSGDGIFADPVAHAAKLGVPTKVYSHGFTLSERLRMAAAEVYLSEDGYSQSAADLQGTPSTNTNIIQLHSYTKETA